MFGNKQAVKADEKSAFSNSLEIAEWRKDLSEKVKEHVDVVEKIIREDSNMVAQAEKKLHLVANTVLEWADHPKSIFKIFAAEKPDISGQVRSDLAQIEQDLKSAKKPDPFIITSVNKIVEQAKYLSEQLAKAGEELDKMKAKETDDLVIDAYNRRISTLFKQQQIVAIGMKEVTQLAVDIQTRPNQVDDLLTTTLPMYKMLCHDILAGKKQSQELRKIL